MLRKTLFFRNIYTKEKLKDFSFKNRRFLNHLEITFPKVSIKLWKCLAFPKASYNRKLKKFPEHKC
jgi:hypothetical protein